MAAQPTSWISYVAICENITSGRYSTWGDELRDSVPQVECGFCSQYKTSGWDIPSLSSAVMEEVRKLTKEYMGEELSIMMVGQVIVDWIEFING
ncbi:hypothetical protein Cni_G14179 [Canna indica]|uniref:Uncharacterized protein n=1 Tax=Canna indica TaxID=4628 RepID=A0AAQ3KDL7_9LILI|nr:hypothetical protein Cni_G14179 [Canna indica]